MNEQQIALVIKKAESMTKPFAHLMQSKACEDIINMEKGSFLPMVIGILSSTLTTCLSNAVNAVKDDAVEQEQNELFKYLLMHITGQSLFERQEYLNKRNMH